MGSGDGDSMKCASLNQTHSTLNLTVTSLSFIHFSMKVFACVISNIQVSWEARFID